MTDHGLDHSDADVVVEAAAGWYFRRLLEGGRVQIRKYHISNPNAGEAPDAELTLKPEQWHELVAAIGLGESATMGEFEPPAEPPPTAKRKRSH